MSAPIPGIVTNGVVVPSSPLPEGATVRILLSWIAKHPDRFGGDACVRDTRITVWGLVAYRRVGLSDADIAQTAQGLTQADLEAAWAYAAANESEIAESEIAEAIRANDIAVAAADEV